MTFYSIKIKRCCEVLNGVSQRLVLAIYDTHEIIWEVAISDALKKEARISIDLSFNDINKRRMLY